MSEIDSPFVQYCDKMDERLFEQGLTDYYSHALKLQNEKPDYILKALKDDFKFRAKYYLNIIMSIEGEQGSFKSFWGIHWAYILGEIFGIPFDIEKNLYTTPEKLEFGLRNSNSRTTHVLDEQRNKNVGVGSSSVSMGITDFEEMGRATQKNIIFISPDVREHAHYFIFSSYSSERIENKEQCGNCPINREIALKQKKKPEINQEECYKNKFKTNCGIPSSKRTGYPKSLTFLLKTKRKIDGWLVPRGFVKMNFNLTPETFIKYDEIKMKNIKLMETEKEDSFMSFNKIVDDFVNSKLSELLTIKGNIIRKVVKGEIIEIDNRSYIPVSPKLIEAKLYIHMETRRKYTTKEIELFVALSKEKLTIISQQKNNKLRDGKIKIIEG